MTAVGWFANSAALTLTSGATEATVAALKNVKVTPHFETAELYGMESVLRKGVAKYQFSVDVAVEFAMWDATADIIMGGFLKGANIPAAASYTVDDTSTYRSQTATFNIVATLTDFEAASTMTLTVASVYFNDVPVDLRENEWVSRNMTGKGENFTIAYAAV